jgi:protein-L-isoaspartate O-methyltransferase
MKRAKTIATAKRTRAPAANPAIAPAAVAGRESMAFLVLFGATVFASAFLLFQVQPLVGKFILPWFGGLPSVWTTCLLFFQVVLFAGYAYAHFTNRWFGSRAQLILHLVLLVSACAALPVIPNAFWKPTGAEEPVSRIIGLLAVTVGLPFFVLSATGPLLQSWYARISRGRSPYRLYSLSNAGSLLALVSFPVLFEWLFPNRILAWIWSASFVAFAIACGICGWWAATQSAEAPAETPLSTGNKRRFPALSAGAVTLWFLLSSIPSILLLATTNQLCLDMASMPFLWVLPLALYLLTFILCFDSDRWYSRKIFMPAAAVALSGAYPLLRYGAMLPLAAQIGGYSAIFFLCAMMCHGELVHLKPDVRHLTAFYLAIAGGGALGGICVAIVAPILFSNYYELHVGLFAAAVIMLIVLYADRTSRLFQGRPHGAWLAMLAGTALLATALLDDTQDPGGYRMREGGIGSRGGLVAVARNFYGALKVIESEIPSNGSLKPVYELYSGTTLHGAQYVESPLWSLPTTYYGPGSGIGRVMSHLTGSRSLKVGVIGLGAGTMAAYARSGDDFRFYEINPNDVEFARRYFHYLPECRGKVDVVLGDGRLSLERESPQNFDVLVIDAFSGDAIPVHLLTKEAFGVYLRHLKPTGILAIHITNNHFELDGVVEAVAAAHGLTTAAVDSVPTNQGDSFSAWMLAASDSQVLAALKLPRTMWAPRRILWTDDYASLFGVWSR